MQTHLTLRDGRKILLNTPEEEARINAGIAADPDTHEVSDAEFALMRCRARRWSRQGCRPDPSLSKWVCAYTYPAAPMRSRNAGSDANRHTALANASASPGGITRPTAKKVSVPFNPL